MTKRLSGMQPETRQSLEDVVAACDELIAIASPNPQIYVDSRRDALAIERLFEIVGEALSRIRAGEPAILEKITDAGAIIGMRNVIAHGYDAISADRVVEAIELRVEPLRDEALGLLGR